MMVEYGGQCPTGMCVSTRGELLVLYLMYVMLLMWLVTLVLSSLSRPTDDDRLAVNVVHQL